MNIQHSINKEAASASFYRTVAGAELDLILETPTRMKAFGAKLSLSPTPAKGYHLALNDLDVACGQVVYSGTDNYRMARGTKVMSLADAMRAAADTNSTICDQHS